MKEYDYDTLIFPEGMSEEEQTNFKAYFRWQAKQNSRLCVIYNPDCGCKVDQFFTLDRFPMSKKIHNKCSVCLKYCLSEITDPILFHCLIRKEDYTLEELKKAFVLDSDQKFLIEAYQNQA